MSSSQLNASLLRLKLLDALRGGDNTKVTSIIDELSNSKSTIQSTEIHLLKQTVLHYAVQVAPLSTLQYLIGESEKYDFDVNSQDPEGNTPLHLAALSSRYEIVKYLLSLPQINDSIANLKKKQPVELTKDFNIAQLMQLERAKFVEKLAGQLRQYFSNRDFASLDKLLVQNPRASELLDINGADPDTGNTVLHEFIMKDDLQMCDWILKHGGDPFKRDKRGKLPVDLIHGKNDPLKKLLKLASKDQNIMDPVVSTSSAIKTGGAPTQKGYLRKWTNFASGYKLRYFVLDQSGILSYYTNQDETNNACRGSLNLGFATLHLDSSEKLKFEIIGKNGMRWHLKANHPIETNRWVWTLQNAITIAKDKLKKKGRLGQVTEGRKSSESVNSTESKKRRFRIRKHKRSDSAASATSEEVHPNFSKEVDPNAPNLAKISESNTSGLLQTGEEELVPPTDDQYSQLDVASSVENDYDLDEEDFDSDDDEESDEPKTVTGGISDQLSTVRRSLTVELTSLLDLFAQVGKSESTGDRSSEICQVGTHTLTEIQELLGKYDILVQSRDTKLTRKYERQLEVNKLWENSIRQLEDEIRVREAKLAELDGKKRQLKRLMTNKSSGLSTPGSGKDLTSEDQQLNELVDRDLDHDRLLGEILNDSDEEFFDADEFSDDEEINEHLEEIEVLPSIVVQQPEINDDAEESSKKDIKEEVAETDEEVTDTIADSGTIPEEGASAVAAASAKETSATEVASTKEKSAEEATASEVTSSKYNDAQNAINELLKKEESFLGYENPARTKLAMDEDNRPKVGLFGILKSMIGKDMTRMTLPVSFNEPTSLVQRLAEDIEYAPLLDTAATYDDSTLRIIYVAAFAASEYASTIDRIAKPFNPLLGETFEYSHPANNYRLFVEQVSHHPPISACSAQSPKWDYFGENAVESQFKGRSFDFKHLGKMFCTIRPDNGVTDKKGNQVDSELYSWKKVNTSVVGIIVGNPTVDNYGKMEVTNHTTGDTIIVDLKQRGWRASSAYQLAGQSHDPKGVPKWAIHGHWNSKIFGRKIQGSSDETPEVTKLSKDPFSGQTFLVWQATKRPKVPFNLTSFALTLNGLDENLKKWVAPTDTRLRPDQRAMEDGQYDKAADEKNRVEVKQRDAKKARDQKKVAYKPNWFVKDKHPITGDNFWEFKGDYWTLRRDGKLAGTGDIF